MPHKTRTPRPKHWAKPLYDKNLPNLWQVTPWLFRSSCPRADSLNILHKLNIHTILCLCHEKEEIQHFPNIQTIHIPMYVKNPNQHTLNNALSLLEKHKDNILVHCTHGADRTGLVIALYRIKIQGWTKEEALAEMLEGGYGYHIFWPQGSNFLKNLPPFL